MDIISFNEAATANGRIEKFIENPDSNSGIVTVPKVIEAGESVTVPAGRVAVLPNVQVDGTLNVQGDVFIPSGATMSKVVEKVASTDNAIVRFNGATGDVQNSGAYIDDSGNVGIGTSSPFSSGGKSLHIYNSLNDGTLASNASLYIESMNRNANIFLKGFSNSLQFVDIAGITNGILVFDHINKALTMSSPAGLGYGTGSGGTVTQLTSKSTAVTLNKPCGKITMNNAALAAGAVVYFIFYNSLITISDTVVINTQGATYVSLNSYDVKAEAMANGFCYITVKNNTASSLSEAIGLEFTVIKGAIA